MAGLTLPLVDTWNVRGVKGPIYKVGPRCSHPQCERWADHAHHLVRRSQLGGDYNWVEIDGKLFANLTGLCVEHHDDVTGRAGGHRAAIRLEDDGLFYWSAISVKPHGEIVYMPFVPLDPQPPTPDSLAQRASTPEKTESEHCPFCGQTTRRRRTTAPTRRRRKSWGLLVPDDQEDGADVLDTLVDELAPAMGIEPDRTGRYYIAVAALYYAVQNLQGFVQSWRGVG